MKVWRAFRGPVLVSAVVTALVVVVTVALKALPDSDDAAEELSPLSPSGGEQLAMAGSVVVLFLVVLGVVLIVTYLRRSGRSTRGS